MCDRTETPCDGENPKYTDQDERSDKPYCHNSVQLLTAELSPPLVPRGMSLRSTNDLNKHRPQTADAATSDAEPSLYPLWYMNEDGERVHRSRKIRKRLCCALLRAYPCYAKLYCPTTTAAPVQLRLLEHMEAERERAVVIRGLRRRARAAPLAQPPPFTPSNRHPQLPVPHTMVTTPFQTLHHMDRELERVHAVGGLRPSMTATPEPLPLDLTTRHPHPHPHQPHSEADSSQ